LPISSKRARALIGKTEVLRFGFQSRHEQEAANALEMTAAIVPPPSSVI
jgi:hypothetical protein